MKVELQLNCTGGWVDYSNYTDITRFTRELSLDQNNDPRKQVTGTIAFFGSAYTFVYAQLINSVNMYSNSICVRVTDNVCTGEEYLFKIDNKNLKWCDDEGCEMTFDMAGYEPQLDCIRNTPISDNTNHDFDQFGPIVHPRFRYCDVFKPTLVFGFLMALAGIVDTLIIVINALVWVLNSVLGLGLTPIGSLQALLSGCTRGWPSPFIRTYIDNVCAQCGATADASTMPVFYDVWNPLQPITNNPYYYATLVSAYTKKGVPMNGSQSYIPMNAPSWTLTRFLSILKPVWNARWFIINNNIFFHRKDLIGNLIWGSTPVLDFTTASDKANLIEGVCFEWNGEGKPHRLYYSWKEDSTDAVGNEVLSRFRGQFLDTSGNPNYIEAIDTIVEEFGACGFLFDGNDSQYDEIAGATFGPSPKGSIKTTTDTTACAKIVCYDPASDVTDARALYAQYTAYSGFVGFEDDDPAASSTLPLNCIVPNYPMSFAPDQNTLNRNLWQWHEIDQPAPDKKTNIAFEFKLNYCCTYAPLNLYQKVKMKDGSIGEIDYVQFDHETRTITVKGNLL